MIQKCRVFHIYESMISLQEGKSYCIIPHLPNLPFESIKSTSIKVYCWAMALLCFIFLYMWGSWYGVTMVTPIAGLLISWKILYIKMYDLGVPPFLGTSICQSSLSDIQKPYPPYPGGMHLGICWFFGGHPPVAPGRKSPLSIHGEFWNMAPCLITRE